MIGQKEASWNSLASLLLIARATATACLSLLAPLRPQRHLLHLGSALPQAAHLDGHLGALLLWRQLRHQLRRVPARLLRLNLAALLRHLHEGVDLLLMALLRALLNHTAGSTDLDRKLLTTGVPHKLAGALLNVPGCAGRLVLRPTLLCSLPVANLPLRSVALPHRLCCRLRPECDLAALLKVLLTLLFLLRVEHRYVGVVALLHVLVGALQDRILGQGLHRLLLDHTQSTVRLPRRLAEVDSSRYSRT